MKKNDLDLNKCKMLDSNRVHRASAFRFVCLVLHVKIKHFFRTWTMIKSFLFCSHFIWIYFYRLFFICCSSRQAFSVLFHLSLSKNPKHLNFVIFDRFEVEWNHFIIQWGEEEIQKLTKSMRRKSRNGQKIDLKIN